MVIKTLDPDWIRIRIDIQPKMLDPDPYQMNTNPKPWLHTIFNIAIFIYSMLVFIWPALLEKFLFCTSLALLNWKLFSKFFKVTNFTKNFTSSWYAVFEALLTFSFYWMAVGRIHKHLHIIWNNLITNNHMSIFSRRQIWR